MKKTTGNGCQNALKKNIEKNSSKIDFGVHFGVPKPPKMLRKPSQIASQSDAEQSLLRDAMEIAKKSSQGNGGHGL